jgi:biopolymer transport protein ExbD
MRFYTRKKTPPTIIIMSLVDILAILLIFFIVTTTFKKEQPQLKINLPDSKTAKPLAADKKEPLILAVRDENNITLGDKPVKLANLGQAITEAHDKEPERPLALQADRQASFGIVVKVLDALKQAGIQNVPTFTQPQQQQQQQ